MPDCNAFPRVCRYLVKGYPLGFVFLGGKYNKMR